MKIASMSLDRELARQTVDDAASTKIQSDSGIEEKRRISKEFIDESALQD